MKRRPRRLKSSSRPATPRAAPHSIPRECRVVMGRNTVREVLRRSPERIRQGWLLEETGAERSERDSLRELFRSHGVKTHEIGKEAMRRLTGSDSHQGVVIAVDPSPQRTLKEWIESLQAQPSSLVVLVDAVHDPQNLGAILRAAECFGADLVVRSSNRGSEITPVVTKAAVGATELVPHLEVSNLADAARKLKQGGHWLIAADCGDEAQEIGSFRFPERSALILGSEGEGVQRLLLELADFTLKIPLFGVIDSLNVSQACAVILSWYRQGRSG